VSEVERADRGDRRGLGIGPLPLGGEDPRLVGAGLPGVPAIEGLAFDPGDPFGAEAEDVASLGRLSATSASRPHC